ncbi:hypothetical protein [Blastococcus brunescens]|uniref:Uncharacterized protein n=1 Tax=Blastococcus brunescens TaxID=1564165 RepID=A0ABZ1B7M1_9ACTN|nr:hypothetical protein [Blastococcus sp. BMG 8361]WRL66377.1 hypothetical protein U6N30_13620 [Blastococcus sp. BMG 8361]
MRRMRAPVVVRTAVRPDAGWDRGPDAAPGRVAAPLGRLRRMLLLIALLSLTACGLPGDGSVAPVAVPPGPTARERTDPAPDGGAVLVWFVRGSRLEAVPRQADEPGPSGALELLLAGPTRAEAVDGFRTALSAVDLVVPGSPTGPAR